jgi:hypothetical protein
LLHLAANMSKLWRRGGLGKLDYIYKPRYVEMSH